MRERLAGRVREKLSLQELLSVRLFANWVESLKEISSDGTYPQNLQEWVDKHSSFLGSSFCSAPIILSNNGVKKVDVNAEGLKIRIDTEKYEPSIASYNGYNFDLAERTLVLPSGKKVRLSTKEALLFGLLIVNEGKVVHFDQIRDLIWYQKFRRKVGNEIRVYINYLREKIHDNERDPCDWHIKNRKGEGYFLDVPNDVTTQV